MLWARQLCPVLLDSRCPQTLSHTPAFYGSGNARTALLCQDPHAHRLLFCAFSFSLVICNITPCLNVLTYSVTEFFRHFFTWQLLSSTPKIMVDYKCKNSESKGQKYNPVMPSCQRDLFSWIYKESRPPRAGLVPKFSWQVATFKKKKSDMDPPLIYMRR